MAKKQFKAESKRLLDLMINSIYTNKEIFLRELISNASDAVDKLYYNEGGAGLNREDLAITLAADKDERTLTLTDKGVGMTKEELETNLGTIAKSGTFAFKKVNEKKEDIDIIGQFGVGFYSAFMVAKKVEVVSRAYGADEAWCWASEGADGYTVTAADRGAYGSTITLYLKDDTEEETYSDYLEEYRLKELVRKYSDYIRYPITMVCGHSKPVEGTDKDAEGNYKTPEYETVYETETLNSMVPLWKRRKAELTEEDYKNFYSEKFYDYEAPLRTVHTNAEGMVSYNALLFVPGRAPYDYYTKNFEKGLQLYSNGVLIMEKCADLLPDHFSFVKGVVDSPDLSLNISREMLQQDRQLKTIANAMEKKIKNELAAMLKDDREKYEKFFEAFGLQLKFGLYQSYGMKKDLLQDLLLFHTSHESKQTTLAEYVERMGEEQKYIYYACGETVAKLELLPTTELLKEKGYEILYLTDDVDEFLMKMLGKYAEKELKNVADPDLGLESEAEKEEIKQAAESNKDLLTAIKEALGDKVAEVTVTGRLKNHPACLSARGQISLEMEKVLAAMPGQNEKVTAEKVLELNANHPIFRKMQLAHAADDGKIATYAAVLYNQARLIEGLPIEDPVAYANAVCELIG